MDAAPSGFGSALLAAAAVRPEIVAVTADLGRYTELTEFAKRYPERLINVGMAEQNLVAVTGGLAMSGLRPVATTFAAFLTRRAQDFVVMQIALPRYPVLLVGGIPGICPSFGPSHASVDDLATMRACPGMVVLDPCDAVEQALATEAALAHDGPVYMRKLRGREPVVYDRSHGFAIGRATRLREGGDVTIVASGLLVADALEAASGLAETGVSAAVINASSLAPFDEEAVVAAAEATGALVTAENHGIRGGLFSAVAEALAGAGVGAPVVPIGIRDEFPHFGETDYLKEHHRMTAGHIAEAAREAIERRDRRTRSR
jgi:transketolase